MLRRYVTLPRFHITRVLSYLRTFVRNFSSRQTFFRQIMSYMWCKKNGSHRIRFRDEKKMVSVIQHGLLGFILKSIECQEPSECVSTEASDL